MFDFDLQIFAEDEVAEEQTVETTAEETATDESVAEEAATEPEEKEPIPDELDGLPEDVAREAMAEAAKMRKEEEPKEKQEEDAAEIDDSDIVKNQAIPYPRWKQKVAENAAMKEELESYKKRFGELNATNNVPQGNQNAGQVAQQPMATSVPQSRPMPQQMPQIQLTPDVMRQIEALKKQEALRMSGLTQEDLDGMDYMEENDPRRAQYQFALKMAEGSIMNRIQQAQVEQMRQAEQFLQAHDASVRAYNEAYTKAAAEPDFNDVVKYATEDYFYSKSPIEQQTIVDAYTRVERKVASPAEIMLVKNYFAEAQSAYRNQSKTPQNNSMQKSKEAKSFPRSQQVSGSSDNDTGVSVATLEQMLQTKPWDEIPPKYQKMLMGD